jgi:hypothetical protein
MENAPEAAGEAPQAPQTEATPTNSNQTAEAPAAPDMHGFTSEQLADMQKFFQANGGYDKVKSKISNPTPAPVEEPKAAEPVQPAAPVSQQDSQYTPPAGAMTLRDIAIKTYFERLAEKEEYSGISKEIADGTILKEMDNLGIRAVNVDGSINPKELFGYLDLRVKTVPAKQSTAMPEAAAAPTVDYVPVGETINSVEEAKSVLLQDSSLKRRGLAGHPAAQKAEEYLKNALSGGKK